MKRNTFAGGNKRKELEDFMEHGEIVYDGEFSWKNVMNTSTCFLTIYELNGKRVGIAREHQANNGMSVTNGAETLWSDVNKKYGKIYIMIETYSKE